MGAKCKKYPISHLFYPTENENEMLNGKKVEKKNKKITHLAFSIYEWKSS